MNQGHQILELLYWNSQVSMSHTEPPSLQVWAKGEGTQGPRSTGQEEAGKKPRKDKVEPMEKGL